MWGYGAVQQPTFSTQIPRWGEKGERPWQEAVLGTAGCPPPPAHPLLCGTQRGFGQRSTLVATGRGKGVWFPKKVLPTAVRSVPAMIAMGCSCAVSCMVPILPHGKAP